MDKTKNRQLLEWIIAGVIALLSVSAVVLVYKYCGTHIVNDSGSTDYKWRPNQYMADATEGINYLHMDSNGFNNLSGDTGDIDILLMGGSHMEAIQIPTSKNTASLLNNLLPGCYTYNIGVSAHKFITCLDNINAAVDEFQPKSYVIVQTSDLSMSLTDIKSVEEGTLQELPSYDSGIIYYLQLIPSIKIIYQQLSDKIKNDNLWKKSNAFSGSPDYSTKSSVLSSVLLAKEKYCETNGCQLILAYTPEISINEAGEIGRNDDFEWVSCVREICESNGIVFLDCFDAFKLEYDESFCVPFGFHNSRMAKWHLNADGHRILVSVIAEYIEGESK